MGAALTTLGSVAAGTMGVVYTALSTCLSEGQGLQCCESGSKQWSVGDVVKGVGRVVAAIPLAVGTVTVAGVGCTMIYLLATRSWRSPHDDEELARRTDISRINAQALHRMRRKIELNTNIKVEILETDYNKVDK